MTTHRGTRHGLPASEVGALLATRLAVAGPSPEFADRLRERIVAAAPTRAEVRGVRTSLRRPWLPRLVVGSAAGVVAVAGVGIATGRALPGQPFYAAKRQVESWQLALHHGDASRGREQLAFARTRLAEVTALSRHHELTGAGAGSATDDRIAPTLRTMDAETSSGADDLAAAAGRGDADAATDLLVFATRQSADLAAVVPDLPGSAAPAVASSRALLVAVRSRAAALPGASATRPGPAGQTPPAAGVPTASSSPTSVAPSATPPATPSGATTPAVAPSGTGAPRATSSVGASTGPTDPAGESSVPSDTPTGPPSSPSTTSDDPSTEGPTAPASAPGIVLPPLSLPPVGVGGIAVGPAAPGSTIVVRAGESSAGPFGLYAFARLLHEVRFVLGRTSQ